MGILGLHELYTNLGCVETPVVIRPDFAHQPILIDMGFGAKNYPTRINMGYGYSGSAQWSYLRNIVQKYRKSGFEPVIVCDGTCSELKSVVIKKRREAQESKWTKMYMSNSPLRVQNGPIPSECSLFGTMIYIELGVRVILAEGEADRLLALLAKQLNAKAVCTCDTDMLVQGTVDDQRGCPVFHPKSVEWDADFALTVVLRYPDSLAEKLGLAEKDLYLWALLMGSDYISAKQLEGFYSRVNEWIQVGPPSKLNVNLAGLEWRARLIAENLRTALEWIKYNTPRLHALILQASLIYTETKSLRQCFTITDIKERMTSRFRACNNRQVIMHLVPDMYSCIRKKWYSRVQPSFGQVVVEQHGPNVERYVHALKWRGWREAWGFKQSEMVPEPRGFSACWIVLRWLARKRYITHKEALGLVWMVLSDRKGRCVVSNTRRHIELVTVWSIGLKWAYLSNVPGYHRPWRQVDGRRLCLDGVLPSVDDRMDALVLWAFQGVYD